MHISNLDTVVKIKPEMEGAKGITKQVPLSKEDGAPTCSFRVFSIEPGGHTPRHSHPFEHMNYIIEGAGTAVSGESENKIRKGDFILVMPGETHQYINTSASEPLVMICAVPVQYE